MGLPSLPRIDSGPIELQAGHFLFGPISPCVPIQRERIGWAHAAYPNACQTSWTHNGKAWDIDLTKQNGPVTSGNLQDTHFGGFQKPAAHLGGLHRRRSALGLKSHESSGSTSGGGSSIYLAQRAPGRHPLRAQLLVYGGSGTWRFNPPTVKTSASVMDMGKCASCVSSMLFVGKIC